jgi:hypothetical protein
MIYVFNVNKRVSLLWSSAAQKVAPLVRVFVLVNRYVARFNILFLNEIAQHC